jgi:hypothetical protein
MREQDEELGVSDGISTQGTATPIPKEVEQPSDIEPTILEGDESSISSPVLSTWEKVKPRTTDDGHEVEFSDSDRPQPDVKDGEVDDDDKSLKNVGDNSEFGLEDELDKLFLAAGRTKKERLPLSNDTKPKIGAAKAKRQKKAEKQAALEAEGKLPPKSHKNRKPYDPSAAIQKARGETVTTGRKSAKKK